MAKFNVVNSRKTGPQGPISAAAVAGTVTHEGAPAFNYDLKSELFMLAVSNMVGEDTFYEKATKRDDRYARLVREVAVTDLDWMIGFVGWLRGTANMRSASLVAAAEGLQARTAAKLPGPGRKLVDAALQRADEPGEFIAYWKSRFGRTLPAPAKKGLGDAARRLYNEYALLKYDTGAHDYRFADVIDLVHPTPTAPWQNDLFRHALDRRHGRDAEIPDTLHMVRLNQDLREGGNDPQRILDPEILRKAGMTWKNVLSLLGNKVNKAQLWEAVIPSMGLMALARNLRNFDQAGVSDQAAEQVIARFSDPEQVARSRMFPYRWLAAYEQAPSLRWGHGLDLALRASTAAIPELPGRTLVLVDTSLSMTRGKISQRSVMTPEKAAAIFGVALACRNQRRAELVGFADGTFTHHINAGSSPIAEIARFCQRNGEVGHGTQIGRSLRERYRGHDRVFIISDMQTMRDRDGIFTGQTDAAASVPDGIPVYGVNLGGYATTVIPAGRRNRYEFGGLSDAMFQMIPLLEQGVSQSWPWAR